MSRDIRISAAMMGYSAYEQRQILNHAEAGTTPDSKRLREGVEKVLPILNEEEEVVRYLLDQAFSWHSPIP